jgi:hypothetical protein
MWVQLTSMQYVDENGQQKRKIPGDWVNVSKHQARKWIKAGQACAPQVAKKVEVKPPPEIRHQIQAQITSATMARRGTGPERYTIFCVPRAWEGIYKIRQENAINSWLRLEPKPEIILCCDDEGVADAAQRFGCIHIPGIVRNAQGTPLISDIFAKCQRRANTDLMSYINSDIIVYQNWADALLRCAAKFPEQFLMVGRRYDVDILEPIDFAEGWQDRVFEAVRERGRQHNIGAIDVFGFWRGLYDSIPPFAVGRSAWDNWLVVQAVYKRVPTVEAQGITLVHQDMPPKKRPPKPGVKRDAEKQRNWDLYNARPLSISGSGRHTTWILDKAGRFRERRTKWIEQIL